MNIKSKAISAYLLGFLSAAGLATSAGADTLLNSGNVTSSVEVRKNDGTPTNASVNPTGLPYASGLLSAPGNSQYDYSAATYDLTQSRFAIAIEQARSPDFSQGFAQSAGSIIFYVTSETSYALSASYSVHLNSGVEAVDFFDLALTDLTTSSNLYYTANESEYTVDQTFNASTPHGDYSNSSLPSNALAGVLEPNHVYELSHNFFIEGLGWPGDTGASATGSIELDLAPVAPAPGNAEAAPLPQASWGGIALLALIGFWGWRGRSAACGKAE